MHRIRNAGRPVALVALAAVLLAIVAWFSGAAPDQDRALAELDWGAQYYISCADTYLDIPPAVIKGEPPGPEDAILSAKSLSRGEPSQTQPGAVQLTQAVYIGPDEDGNLLPERGPSVLPCVDPVNWGGVSTGDKTEDGQFVPENNRLDNYLNYAIPSENRTIQGKLVDKGAQLNLEYTTCIDVPTSQYWQRTDVVVVLNEKGPKAINFGVGTLYTEATSPTNPEDPTTCGTPDTVLWENMFPFVIATQTRDATTDHPELPANELAILQGDLLIDPDGPHPKVKGEKQLPDGDSELALGPYARGEPPHVSPMLADDWDGDGCPDWDELDPVLNGGVGTANGLDPYNPHDCNQAVNVSGIYRVSAEALAAAKEVPGAYFHCIADMQQDGNDLEMRLYCYTDNPAIAVNPEQGDEVGDGYEGVGPPWEAVEDTNPPAESGAQCQNSKDDDGDTVADDGCPAVFGDVDDVQTVLTGILDKGPNRIVMSGCYEDRDNQSILGDIWLESDQDAHTGRGTVDIYIQQPDGCAGSPVGPPTFDDAALGSVKVSEKGPCDKSEPQCAAGGEHDFDGDNCPDKNELSDNQQEGGLRDPYNRWDYFNPTKDGQNRVDDILAVVNAYFIDKGSPSYSKQYDRTSLVGGNPWNLGPPNGQQRVDDILAAVKSYFHDCSGGKRDDYPPKP